MRTTTSTPAWKRRPLAACLALVLASGAMAGPPAANIVSIQGQGEVRVVERNDWRAAKVEQALQGGDTVRTGDYSRMGVLFRDRTQVRLNEKTQLAIKGGEGETRVRLDSGRAWSQTRSPQGGLTMETPSATAAIRGTDWDMEVAPDGRAVITVLSGEVDFSNEFGRVRVGRNEAAEARVGSAPVKLLMVRPQDRVQWVSAHAVAPRRYLAGLAAGERAELEAAANELDAGRLAPAIARLEQVLRGTPTRAGAHLMLADALVAGGDAERAAGVLTRAIQSFPADGRPHALLARIHLYADRRDPSRQEIELARRDPASRAEAALVAGELARIEGSAVAALDAYAEAIALHAQEDRAWHGLGRVHTEKEDVAPARRDLNRALELNPRGPGYLGELGTLESFANDFAAARPAFARALEQNPDDYVALTGLGVLELKRGNTDAALDALLRAGLMEPRYARVHVYTAVAYYQQGRVPQALGELELAARLDDKDPLPHFMASIIHTDRLQAGEAIAAARTALRLMPYLKSLNQLANDQRGTTNLGQAFAFLGMEEWAQRYAQDSYYPYLASSHLFLADRYPGLFNKNSELYQGFLADPTAFGGSNRFQTLLPKPGNYFAASLRLGSADTFHAGGQLLQANGYANAEMPFAYKLERERFDLAMPDGPYARGTTTVALGLNPRHDTGMFLFADQGRFTQSTNSTFDGTPFDLSDTLTTRRYDIGLHYQPAPDSLVWLKLGQFDSRHGIAGTLATDPVTQDIRLRQPELALRHSFAAGAGHEITWGVEQSDRRTAAGFANEALIAPLTMFADYRYRERSRDAYVSDRWRVDPDLLLQFDLFHQEHLRRASYTTLALYDGESYGTLDDSGQDQSRTRLNPRLGMVLRLNETAQARLAWQRWMRPSSFASLGPVATAGIALDDRLVARGGELRRTRAQLEWEASPRSFVSAYLDHKNIRNPRFSQTPFSVGDLDTLEKLQLRRLGSLAGDDMLEFISTPDFDGGRIRSGGLSVNHLLSERWGVFGRYVQHASRNTGTAHAGNAVPYLPRHVVAAGATWASPEGWYFIGRLVHRSARFSDEANTKLLKSGWNGAFDLYWQSHDRQWLFRLSADDALDRNRDTQYTAEINLRF